MPEGMGEREIDWSVATIPDGGDADSIAAQVASRIEALPAAPGDALDWASIAAGYEREAAALGPDAAAAPLLHEAGRIWEERLGNASEALARYRRAHAVDPGFLPTAEAGRRLALRTGDDALAADLLEAEARAAVDPRDAAALLALRGRVLQRLGRPDEARADLARAAAADPTSFAVVEAQVADAAATGDRRGVARALLGCAEAAGAPDLAAQLLCAAAEILDGLGDVSGALDAAHRALALDPADPVVRATARRSAQRLGHAEALAAALRADADHAPGEAAATPLRELAALESRRGDPDAALAALERARSASPRDTLVLADIAAFREARGDWAEAAAALSALADAHRAAPRPDAGEAIAAHLRRATIEEERLARPGAAADALRAVLALDATHRPALAALGRLCARAGDHAGLAQAFLAEAAAAHGPEERADRLLRAAEVLEERLGDRDGAVRACEEALAAAPGLSGPRLTLERLYEEAGRWAELASLLLAGVDALAAPADRTARLLRVAHLRDARLGDSDGATAACRAAVEASPRDPEALRVLGTLLVRTGRWEEAVDALSREAALVADRERRLELVERAARILDDRLGDPERARAAWEAARALDPRRPDPLRALGRLHARAGRWYDLAALYRVEADAAGSPDAAAEWLVRLAELLEARLGRADEAVAALGEALTLAPGHLRALDAVVRRCRARQEPEALAAALRALAAARTAPAERAACLCEAGRIWEELGNASEAAACHEDALAADPACVPALHALERVYGAEGRLDDLARIRAASAAVQPGPAGAGDLAALAALEADRRGDPAAAARALEALEAALPGHLAAAILRLRLGAADPAARGAARRAIAARAPPPAATILLAGAALDLGAPVELEQAARLALSDPALASLTSRPADGAGEAALAARLEARRDAAEGPAARAHWAVRAGEAWERAGDAERALAAYQAALAATPGCLPALRAARAIFARRGDWAAVRGALQAEGAARRDPAGAAAAWLEAGAIAEERFADRDAAVQDYRAALRRDPRDPAPLARLRAILGDAAAEDVAGARAAQARAEADPARAAEAWLQAARAALSRPNGRDAALGSLDRALAARPDLAPALELRARLRAEADLPGAIDDLEACIALGGEGAALVPLHLGAAALLHAGGSRALAASHLQTALALQPENAEALDRLARIHAEAGSWPAAADALRRLAALPAPGPEAHAARLLALARADLVLGDPARALASCRRALEIHPGDAQAIAALAHLEGAGAPPEELVAAWDAAADGIADPAARADALARGAALLAGPLQDPARAAPRLRAALAEAPSRDDVRARLADAAEEADPGFALEAHRALLAREPLRVESWAALFRISVRTRSFDRAHVAASVLRWLGAPPEGDAAERLRAEADRQVLGPPPPLAPGDWDLLRHPADGGPVAEVIRAAGDALAAAARDGDDRRSEPVRADHPFRGVLDEVAGWLGIDPCDVRGGPAGRIEVDPGDPPALLVGPDLPRRTTLREQRFLIGRAAARLRAGTAIAAGLAPDALAALVAAAVRQVLPGYAAVATPPDELVHRVARALPRRARRGLEQAAHALALLPAPPDVAAWSAAAAATADRAGLVLSGDVPAALRALLLDRGGPTLVGAAAVEAALVRPDARALLAFASTEAHLALRQRARTAIA
jgi:tetratricopeptide (TPR) repeat protein